MNCEAAITNVARMSWCFIVNVWTPCLLLSESLAHCGSVLWSGSPRTPCHVISHTPARNTIPWKPPPHRPTSPDITLHHLRSPWASPHLTSPHLISPHLRSLHFRPTSPEDPQFWWHHLMSGWGTSTSGEVLWMVNKDWGYLYSSVLICTLLYSLSSSYSSHPI